MRTFIIGFSRPKKWKPFAKLIMLADGSDASHGYMKFKSSSWNAEFIYQSSGHRTNFMGGEYFRHLNTIVEEFELTVSDEIEGQIGHFCVSREGKPYPKMQVIGKGLVKLIFLLSCGKLRVSNPFKNGDSETDCIEECSAILNNCLSIKTELDMDTVTVEPFRQWVAQLACAKRVGEKNAI